MMSSSNSLEKALMNVLYFFFIEKAPLRATTRPSHQGSGSFLLRIVSVILGLGLGPLILDLAKMAAQPGLRLDVTVVVHVFQTTHQPLRWSVALRCDCHRSDASFTPPVASIPVPFFCLSLSLSLSLSLVIPHCLFGSLYCFFSLTFVRLAWCAG